MFHTKPPRCLAPLQTVEWCSASLRGGLYFTPREVTPFDGRGPITVLQTSVRLWRCTVGLLFGAVDREPSSRLWALFGSPRLNAGWSPDLDWGCVMASDPWGSVPHNPVAWRVHMVCRQVLWHPALDTTRIFKPRWYAALVLDRLRRPHVPLRGSLDI